MPQNSFIRPYRTHLDPDVNLFFQIILSPYINTFVHSRQPITKTVLKVFFDFKTNPS